MSFKIEFELLKVSDVARHWGLSSEATRIILRRNGKEPILIDPARFTWRQIWSVEQAGHVNAGNVTGFCFPLLKACEVQRLYFPHLSLRAIRQRAAKGTLPGIKLGSDWRFRERDMRAAATHG